MGYNLWKSFSSLFSSESSSGNLPDGVTKLSDSLYELYAPQKGKTVTVDILFFHGLQVKDYRDAYWKTWSADEKTIWPQTLLAGAFPEARILAVSYDSCARRSKDGGRVDMYNIGENLVQDIIESNKASVGRNRPVILVGHSFGGFVIKKLIMTAHNKSHRPKNINEQKTTITNFLENVAGIFYYATPHGGSRLADRVDKLPGNSEVLHFLTTLSKEPAILNNSFRELRQARKIPASTIGESKPTNIKIWGVNFIVVEEASARADTDEYQAVYKDHISVCKPTSADENTFLLLKEFIEKHIRGREPEDLT